MLFRNIKKQNYLILFLTLVSLISLISNVSGAPCTPNTAYGYARNISQIDIPSGKIFLHAINVNKSTHYYTNDSNQIYIGSNYIQIGLGNVGDTDTNTCYEESDYLSISGYEWTAGRNKSIHFYGDKSHNLNSGLFYIRLISNEIPTLSHVNISNNNPTPIDTIWCNYYGYRDSFTPDLLDNTLNVSSSSPVHVYYQWYKNGIAMPGETNENLNLNSKVNVGDIINCSVIVNDGMDNSSAYFSVNSATIKEVPLTLNKEWIFPENPDTTDNLTCYLNFSATLSHIIINFTWYRNGIPLRNFSYNCTLPICNDTLLSQATSRWDNWSCSAIIKPSSSWVGPYITNITIQNARVPAEINWSYPDTTIYTRNPRLSWKPVSDPDGDTVEYQVIAYRSNGSVIFNITTPSLNITLDNLNLSNYTDDLLIGDYSWQVRVYDGFNYSNWSKRFNFSIKPLAYGINLYRGYNLISLPILPENYTTGKIYENFTAAQVISMIHKSTSVESVRSITRWDPVQQVYPLPVCMKVPGLGYVGCDSQIKTGEGFYVEVNGTYGFYPSGRPIEKIKYKISQGYNLVGWNNVNSPINVMDYINMFPANTIKSITRWDAVQQVYPLPVCMNLPGMGYVGCDYNLTPGSAFFIKAENPYTLNLSLNIK